MGRDKEMHDGHRRRLKKRFREEGIENFETHNVLELMLFFAVPYKDVNPLAHKLLNEFGSISAVFDAPYEELVKCDGIGENIATLIKLIPAINRRYLLDKASDERFIESTGDAAEYLIPYFHGYTNEIVVLLCLDTRGKVIGCEKLFEGEVSSAAINIRRIASTALKFNATSAILAHNHPNGFAIPSPDDIKTTKVVGSALATVEVKLADHIIIAGDFDYVSLADSKMI
jgi:DNA repair protein RadC